MNVYIDLFQTKPREPLSKEDFISEAVTINLELCKFKTLWKYILKFKTLKINKLV